MLSSYLLANIIISILLMLIAGLVILKNYKSAQHLVFFFFSVFLSGWIISNYFSNDFSISIELAEIANHLVLFFSGISIILLADFCIRVTHNKFLSAHRKLGMAISVAAVLPTLTSLVVQSIEQQGQVYAINFGVLAPLYFLSIAANVLIIIVTLIQGIRRSVGAEKARISMIWWSLVITLGIAVTTNVIIPLTTGSFELTNLGPLSGIILVTGISYSIIRHKLFDIRLVVARSLAYVFALGTIGAITYMLLFNVATYLGDKVSSEEALRVFYVFATILLAISYLPVKHFFDRLTNKIFYRDAYDTKELLDEFNQTIVSTIELETLLNRSATVIEKYLKPEFVAFGLLKEKESIRLFHSKGTQLTDKVVDQIRSYVRASNKKAYITDALDEETSDLGTLLHSEDIAALIRITKNVEDEGSGYILLGHKRSGSVFNGQDEGAMETVANELAIAIENALQYEEIENFAKTLQNKVDEATRDLRDANEKLKKLDQTKDDFISMASHQLRTPLTSVKGYVSMVLEGDTGKINDKQKEMLNQAFISSQRMVYLIADLLNVSRLRTGKFIIEPKKTNLADLIEGEISQLTETAKGRNLTLTYNKPKNFPELMLDDTKIRQVVMNFADNAIYYTPAGGHINVNLEDKGDTIEFTVVDDGIGVPKSEQHHLFGKFYRAGNAKKARPDGTGLGLFMAKKVVVAQGGSIVFKSAEGKGSTFGFSFAKKPMLPANYKGPITTDNS